MTIDRPTADPVRAHERLRLAAELYDIVAHHLSNVALRTMGPLDLDDPADLRTPKDLRTLSDLRTVLGDVNRSTGAALVELRLLAHVLADDPDGALLLDPVGELSRRLTPTVAAAQWHHRLTAAGRIAAYTVPDAADDLAMSVQSTITRTFDATAEAILRFTALDARSSTTVRIRSDQVTVRSATTLPLTEPARRDQLSHELRGLRERVDLTHGHFGTDLRVSESRHPEWVVMVALPLY